jgi:signal transduction histidine kinase
MTTLDRALLKASWLSWITADGVRVGPYWLQWLWTLLFSIGLAAVFTMVGFVPLGSGEDAERHGSGWAAWYGKNLIVCLTVGAIIELLFDLLLRVLDRRVQQWPRWQRSFFFSGVPLLGIIVGVPLGVFLAGGDQWTWVTHSGRQRAVIAVIGWIAIALLISFVVQDFFASRARQHEAEKRAAEAQLRLLQGQMEPHFMFNTLATVLTLIDTDAPRAKQMLETFIDYLRASLGKLRSGDGTLGDELAMTEAYLGLMQMRMGERLAYRIDVEDAALRQAVLPPLLLQPLVENAIHHGLECKVEGGRIHVSARRDGQRMVIEVDDDGLGACDQPVRRVGPKGSGVALANLRARLQSRWGNAATLVLDLRPDAGARATLTLPFETA